MSLARRLVRRNFVLLCTQSELISVGSVEIWKRDKNEVVGSFSLLQNYHGRGENTAIMSWSSEAAMMVSASTAVASEINVWVPDARVQ